MATNVRVTTTVKSYTNERIREMNRKIMLGNHCAGYAVQEKARSLAPVDTGLLKASITHQVDEGGISGVSIGVHAGPHRNMHSPIPHGHDDHPTAYFCYQELGTRRNKAQPYLRPGLIQSYEKIRACYAGAGARRQVSKRG